MTFSNDVKKELSQLKIENKINALLEMSSILKVNASISIRNAFINIDFTSESEYVAKRIYKIVEYLYGYEPLITRLENNTIQKDGFYKITIEDENIATRILSDCGLDLFGNYTTDVEIIYSRINSSKNKGKESYLRGVFLGSGSIVNPSKSYHLELVTNEEDANIIVKILEDLEIDYLLSNRKGKTIVYIKNSETIATFLHYIGAVKSFFMLEDIKVEKELRNNINRRMNFDMANLNKTIKTSIEQIEAIEKLERLNLIPDELKEVAKIRKEYPELSLNDLTKHFQSKISKTNLAYKLNKLKRMSQEL